MQLRLSFEHNLCSHTEAGSSKDNALAELLKLQGGGEGDEDEEDDMEEEDEEEEEDEDEDVVVGEDEQSY